MGADFAEWLRAGLERRGWSPAETARRTGVGEANLSRALRGLVVPMDENIIALAGALGGNAAEAMRAAWRDRGYGDLFEKVVGWSGGGVVVGSGTVPMLEGGLPQGPAARWTAAALGAFSIGGVDVPFRLGGGLTFALAITAADGAAMASEFTAGDVVVVRIGDKVESGHYCLVRQGEGSACIRQVFLGGKRDVRAVALDRSVADVTGPRSAFSVLCRIVAQWRER